MADVDEGELHADDVLDHLFRGNASGVSVTSLYRTRASDWMGLD